MAENITQLRPKSLFANLNGEHAAELYVEKGVTATTAKELGLSQSLFTAWVRSPEGTQAIHSVQARLNSLLEIGLSEIMNESIHAMKQALREGSAIVYKGEVMPEKLAVSAKEAACVFAIAFDKRQLLRRAPTLITDVDAKIMELSDKLRLLGEQAQNKKLIED